MDGPRGLLGPTILATALACGSRTDLPVQELGTASVPEDSGLGPEVATDAPVPPPDDIPAGCDAGADYLLLLGTDDNNNNLIYRFNPMTLGVEQLAALQCGAHLNSMTVARNGVAYVSADDGQLFTVVPETGNCTWLPFDIGQLHFTKYGMGFVADDVPRGENLYIAEQLSEGGVNIAFNVGIIDLDTFELRVVADFDPPLPPIELTGTGDGRMFGFHVATRTEPARLIEIDKASAEVGEEVVIPIGTPYRAFDFAFWGGDFYLFIALQQERDSAVIRYSPANRSVVTLGRIPPIVVGAGVSTCAPL